MTRNWRLATARARDGYAIGIGRPVVCADTGRAIEYRREPIHTVDVAEVVGPESIAYQATCRDCGWCATADTEDDVRRLARSPHHAANVAFATRATFAFQILATNPRKVG